MLQTMVKKESKMRQVFNSMKGHNVFIYQYGVITYPPILFDNFNWHIENTTSNDKFLVLCNDNDCTRIQIFTDEIFDIESDKLLNEVIIWMNNESLLQIYQDI